MSKCHIVGNHMPRLILGIDDAFDGDHGVRMLEHTLYIFAFVPAN